MHKSLKRFVKEYENENDLALALIAEGMDLLQAIYFAEAVLIEGVTIEMAEQGYIISVMEKELQVYEHENDSYQE